MRIRSWTNKVLWFVCGAVAAGVLMFISTAYGKRPEPAQDILQRVASLEQRVAGLEQYNKQRAAAEAQAAKEAERQRQEQERRLKGGKN